MGRILVTGGTGFIGSHLVGRLVKSGHQVTVISRGRRSVPTGASVVQGYFGDTNLLDKLEKFDGIYHLASGTDPAADLRAVIVGGSETLARWAAARSCPFFFYAGSIEAQGPSEDPNRKQKASDPCRPVSEYGRNKLEAEGAARAEYSEKQGRLVLARIGNTYGSGGDGFIRPFFESCAIGHPAAREFEAHNQTFTQPIFVADLVRLMVRAYESDLAGLFHFVGQETISVADWFRQVRDLVGNPEHRVSGDTGSTDGTRALLSYFSGENSRRQRIYDEAPLFERLGTTCRISTLRGAAETLAWFRNRS